MRSLVLILPLLAACWPLEIKRHRDGSFAYPVVDGIAVRGPDGSVSRFRTSVGWVAWMPDGRVLLTTAPVEFLATEPPVRDSLAILDPATGRFRTVMRHDGGLFCPRASPDGAAVGVMAGGDAPALLTVDLRTGRMRRIAERPGLLHAWSPDGRRIAFVRADRRDRAWLSVAEYPGGKTRDLVPVAAADSALVHFWRGGKHLYYCTLRVPTPPNAERSPAALFAYDFERNAPTQLSLDRESVWHSALSPSGRKLFYVAFSGGHMVDGAVVVVDIDTGRRRLLGANRGPMSPFWSSDETIVVATKGRRPRLFELSLRGGELVEVTDRYKGLDWDR
ncbi:MAG: TolB family protein [Planctomycetota bacterium]